MCSIKGKFGFYKTVFDFFQGLGGFRELREAYRKLVHLSWYLLVPVVTSYSQKHWRGFLFTVHGSKPDAE